MPDADIFVDELMAVGIPWAPATLIADAINDVAGSNNVLEFGADPTGVTDSTAAFRAAAAVTAPNGLNKAVYVPTGTYRINDQIDLTKSQGMIGDTRGSSIIYVDDQFNPAAQAVIMCRGGNIDPGPVIRDIGITFAQPSDQGSRANFKTLAAGGTSGTGGTGVKYPWAIAAGSDSFRIQVVRVRIGGAWDGITTNGHNAVYYLEDIEMGALDCGVSLGEGASGVLDFAHMSGYHFWNFDIDNASPIIDVFYDGDTIALRVGNQNGLDARGINSFVGRVVFTSAASAGWFYITNLGLDSTQATLEIADAFFMQISNMYSTAGPSGTRPRVTVSGGQVQIANYFAFSSSAFPFIYATGGLTTATNVTLLCYNNSVSAVQALGGSIVRITGGNIAPLAGPWSAPILSQSGSGALQVNDIDLSAPSGSGVAISFATDVAANSLGSEIKLSSGSTITIPGNPVNGQYAAMVYQIIGSSVATTEVTLALKSAANFQRQISFETGSALRWRVVTNSETESGANAGANFGVVRFNDAGNVIDAPLIINRATGVVAIGNGINGGGSSSFSGSFSLISLPGSTSYPNDAAAAAGGVTVGGVYRNGSVVQVRVT